MVLLDFPYVFELDGNKIYCNRPIIEGTKFPVCDGEIDYDIGFNNLVCKRCGKHYLAKELEAKQDSKLIIIKGGKNKMKVKLVKGRGKNKKVLVEAQKMTDTIVKNVPKLKKKRNTVLTVSLTGINGITINEEKQQEITVEQQPKEKVEVVKTVIENPRSNINKDEDVVVKEEKEIPHQIENSEKLNSVEETVNDILDNDDDSYFDDEADEYEQYMSNREKRQMRKKPRKISTDVEGF